MSSLVSFKIHPAGLAPIGIFFLISVILYTISTTLGYVGFILSFWCLYFFRDPERVCLEQDDSIVGPADGLIVDIQDTVLPQGLEESHVGSERGKTWKKISIFLNVFDVHVNRSPVKGKVMRRLYHPGQFLNASLDKASDVNERMALLLETSEKRLVWCVQIAGLIARRIVCDIQEGKDLQKGERYGIIRFGSRVDLYLPSDVVVWVCKGQRVVGGETIIARISKK
jgi:phosphatidylserine decarboxylase